MFDRLFGYFVRSFLNPKELLEVLTTRNAWFSHDVTKMQTKKLSILPRFYFHDALEQLKTNFHKKFSLQKGSWFCDRVRLNF